MILQVNLYKWRYFTQPMDPEKKRFERLIFPTKSVIPKMLKPFSHWPSFWYFTLHTTGDFGPLNLQGGMNNLPLPKVCQEFRYQEKPSGKPMEKLKFCFFSDLKNVGKHTPPKIKETWVAMVLVRQCKNPPKFY